MSSLARERLASNRKASARAEQPASEVTKLYWMKTVEQEISEYNCSRCREIFQFASDAGGTEQPPKFCPMCGRENKA